MIPAKNHCHGGEGGDGMLDAVFRMKLMLDIFGRISNFLENFSYGCLKIRKKNMKNKTKLFIDYML